MVISEREGMQTHGPKGNQSVVEPMDRLYAMAIQFSLLTTENAALRERLERVEEETKTNDVWATKRLDAAQKQTEHIRNNFSGELKDMKNYIDDVEQKLSTAIEKRARPHLSFAEVASGSSPTSAIVDATTSQISVSFFCQVSATAP